MTREDFFKGILDIMYDGIYFLDMDRTITYWNKAAEAITGFERSEVIGRRCSDNILVHLDREGRSLCENMCPTAETIADGRPREAEVYLHHKEGHRVPVHVRVSALHDDEGRIVGAVEIFCENTWREVVREKIDELKEQTLLDSLTEVGNRRYGEAYIGRWLNGLQRYGWPFGAMFIDIDNFKEVNDIYEHAVGDRVLRMVAKTIAYSLRGSDAVFRWGGEEFVALISNVDRENLRLVAERTRVLVEKSALPTESGILRVTVSIGASLARSEDTVETLVKRADQMMYRCKKAGRNRVAVD